MSTERLRLGTDGLVRCWWCGDDPLYTHYHDTEWGQHVTNDTRLFEKMCLEGFQSGLSWLTILRKRDNFRAAFADFDVHAVAAFDEDDIQRLLADAGIVRHRGKIVSTINNAQRTIDLLGQFDSLYDYVQQFRSDRSGGLNPSAELVSTTSESIAMSKDLKSRGFSFVGPTTMYAFMQAMGLVNDHIIGCHVLAAPGV